MSKSQNRKVNPTDFKRNRRIMFNEMKRKRGCEHVILDLFFFKIVCGYDKEAVNLDWHHIDPGQKYKDSKGRRIAVSEMISRGLNKKLLENELEKCIVLCKKHHASHHAEIEMKRVEANGRLTN